MSETSNKNIDLRIQKTYALLSKTLLELLKEHGLDLKKIEISENPTRTYIIEK